MNENLFILYSNSYKAWNWKKNSSSSSKNSLADPLWESISKINLEVALLVPACHSSTVIGFTPKIKFGIVMTEFFKDHSSGYKSAFFWDWLAFKDQQDRFYISKAG